MAPRMITTPSTAFPSASPSPSLAASASAPSALLALSPSLAPCCCPSLASLASPNLRAKPRFECCVRSGTRSDWRLDDETAGRTGPDTPTLMLMLLCDSDEKGAAADAAAAAAAAFPLLACVCARAMCACARSALAILADSMAGSKGTGTRSARDGRMAMAKERRTLVRRALHSGVQSKGRATEIAISHPIQEMTQSYHCDSICYISIHPHAVSNPLHRCAIVPASCPVASPMPSASSAESWACGRTPGRTWCMGYSLVLPLGGADSSAHTQRDESEGVADMAWHDLGWLTVPAAAASAPAMNQQCTHKASCTLVANACTVAE